MKPIINYFKLISGEHIISMVDSLDDEYAVLYKPLQLFVHSTYRGASVKVAKWIPFTDEVIFSIRMSNILIHSNASEDMEDYYLGCLNSLDDIQDQDEREQNFNVETNHDEADNDEVTQAFFERYSNTNIVVH